MVNQNKYMYFSKEQDFLYGSTKKNISSIEILKDKLNFKKYYHCQQTHSNKISVIDPEKFYYTRCDGLITFKKLKFPIIIRTADCVPLFFYSKNTHLYGIIHAGRVGTEKKITENLIKIISKYGFLIKNIIFIFGPHICKDCYQINKENNIYYDLYNKNVYQLKQNGVSKDQILNFDRCTLEENDLFSYRHDKTENRIFNFIIKN